MQSRDVERKPVARNHSAGMAMATCRGVELFEVATFPARTPRISGTSLFFDVNGVEVVKLVEFPVPGFRPGGEVTLRIGVTRPACGRGCIAEPKSMAPVLALSDGVNVISIEANGVGAFVGADFRDDGARVSRLVTRQVGTLVAPRPGQSFSIEARFRVEERLTRVHGSIPPYSAGYLSSRALSGDNLHVVLLGGTGGIASYFLDWIAIGWEQAPAAVYSRLYVDQQPARRPARGLL